METIDRAPAADVGAILARQPVLGQVGPEQATALREQTTLRCLEAGEVLVTEQAPSSSVFVVVDGELEIARRVGAHDVPIAARGAGNLVGEMGVLTGLPRSATLRARGRTRVLEIDGDAFQQAVRATPEAMIVVMRTMVERLQSAEAELVRHQKMAALGILAAGLTHELNNPAAAVARSADQLQEAVFAWESTAVRLGATALPEREAASLATRRQDLVAHARDGVWLDPLARSDRERAVQEWLQRADLAEPWKLAPALVDAGWDVEQLRQIAATVSPRALAVVVEWLATGQTVLRLVDDLTTSAHAIAEIVAAVKAYTRLDQAPIQLVDVHEGLDQSLTILRYKLRSVIVRREYAGAPPQIRAYASELNQVWTNLIDNAIDAMDGEGDLTIRTHHDDQAVVVDVIDSGPGIPAAVEPHLFEPFFTTKPPGKGTGLGLAITYGIVRNHQGEIRFDSRPGHTRVTVRLPIAGIKE